MRVSRKQAQENQDRVIDTAARLLRERGYDGIGVADLMKAAGLTHGGFYRSFASKDDMIGKVTAHMIATANDALATGIAARPDDPFKALIDTYISATHCADPGSGCILPTLGIDAARRSDPALHEIFTQVIRGYLRLLEDMAPAMPADTRRRPPAAILAEMVGAIVLSRATEDTALADEVICAVASDLSDPAAA